MQINSASYKIDVNLQYEITMMAAQVAKFVLQESASDGKTFNIVQPGSSVATALSEGEAKPKHVMVLEILEESWRTIKLPLQTVRPFIYDTVSSPHSALLGAGHLPADDLRAKRYCLP